MLLALHILFGLIASASSIAVFVGANKQTNWLLRAVVATIRFTSLSVLSGIALIVQGGSLARVCGEALMLVALSAGSVYYAKNKSKEIGGYRANS